MRVLSVGPGVDQFVRLVGRGHKWNQEVGLEQISEVKYSVAGGLAVHPSSGLNSTPVMYLMAMQSCDAKMLNCLVKCVGVGRCRLWWWQLGSPGVVSESIELLEISGCVRNPAVSKMAYQPHSACDELGEINEAWRRDNKRGNHDNVNRYLFLACNCVDHYKGLWWPTGSFFSSRNVGYYILL